MEEWIERRDKAPCEERNRARFWRTVWVFVALFLGTFALPTFLRTSW